MKKVPKTICCARCGDEIAVDESAQPFDHLCVFCCNMRLEARQIAKNQRQRLKLHSASIYSVPVSSQ